MFKRNNKIGKTHVNKIIDVGRHSVYTDMWQKMEGKGENRKVTNLVGVIIGFKMDEMLAWAPDLP